MKRVWQRLRIGVAVVVAVVACPCHLPLTVPLILAATGGTLFGLTAGTIYRPLFVVFTMLFLGGMYFSFRWISNKSKAHDCPAPNFRRRTPGRKVDISRAVVKNQDV